MAYRVTIAAEAAREYEQIISYLSHVLSSQQAARSFADEFARQIASVRANPEIRALSRMPELAARGYRPFLVNRNVALYKVVDEEVIIAHVFHQSQDYAKLV